MAFEVKGFAFTAEAGSDLSAAQYKFVKVAADGQIDVVVGPGVSHDGVLQNDPAAQGRAGTVVKGGIVKVIAGAAIARGAELQIDAQGRAITATGHESVGRALEAAGTAGDRIAMLLADAPYVYVPRKVNVETLAGNKTLVTGDAMFQKLDPAGARDVTLPTDGAFLITNAADAAENITVKNAAAATIVTLNQNESAWVVSDGAGTWAHMGVMTIAQT